MNISIPPELLDKNSDEKIYVERIKEIYYAGLSIPALIEKLEELDKDPEFINPCFQVTPQHCGCYYECHCHFSNHECEFMALGYLGLESDIEYKRRQGQISKRQARNKKAREKRKQAKLQKETDEKEQLRKLIAKHGIPGNR